MSLRIHQDKISNEDIVKINSELRFNLSTKYETIVRNLYAYMIDNNDIVSLPFYYALNTFSIKTRKKSEFKSNSKSFVGILRNEQKIVVSECISDLNKFNTSVLSLYTGFGKTIMSIKISSMIKLKTLVIVNKLILITQWRDSILKFSPDSNVKLMTDKSYEIDDDNDYDYYIINAINIVKYDIKTFQNIGLVIVDELHLILAESLSRCLHYLSPKYLLGLSATPYRKDGLNKLIEIYFGTKPIIRTMNREHVVYKVYTGFKPTMEKSDDGKIIWGSILKQQADNEERNNLIVNIVRNFKDRKFLILVKRVEHGRTLLRKLQMYNEYVTSLLGNEQTFDKKARILVGTTSKCSTGFDHSSLDSLILASDIQDYFIQALGRVFRTKDVIPIIFDIVDDNPILMKHYKTREIVYKDCGGDVRLYKNDIKDDIVTTHKRLLLC